MSVLRIFDVSQYISAGVGKNRISQGVEVQGDKIKDLSMPCAGIANVLNAYKWFKSNNTDMIFCLDSPPTVKRELHTRLFPGGGGYKGKRPKKSPAILLQRQMIEDVLRQTGIRYMKFETYEADDIIASLVKYYKDEYEKIYIHSKDSDQYYLVDDTVEVVPVVKQGKHVTRSNWEYTVMKDAVVPYNTLTLQKMADGESGDNIPYVYAEQMNAIVARLRKSAYHLCGDNELLRDFIAGVTNNDERTMGIFDLIAPRILDAEQVEIFEEEFNQRIFDAYAIACGCHGYDGMNSIEDETVNATIERYIAEYVEATTM